MALTERQRGVRKGVIIALVLTIVGLGGGITFIPTSLTPDSSTGERLALALKADILVIFWLFHCIAKLGNHRFRTPEDIDGGGLTIGTQQAKMLQAILQNTLEQTVFAITVHMIWAAVLPVSWISGILAAAILFCIGRTLFIHGYPSGAPSRALGFALTFYPSVIMLLIATIKILLGFAG